MNSSSLFTVSDMVFSFISTVQHGAHKSVHSVSFAAVVVIIITIVLRVVYLVYVDLVSSGDGGAAVAR